MIDSKEKYKSLLKNEIESYLLFRASQDIWGQTPLRGDVIFLDKGVRPHDVSPNM